MNKKISLLFSLLVLCSLFSGCTILHEEINEFSRDKVSCYLNTVDVTQFTCKDQKYTILNETVSNGDLGDWIGYIRKLAAVDEGGRILLQENIVDATFQTLADLSEKASDAAYIIPFLNVYTAPNDNSYLIVDVNGGYYKAIPSEAVTNENVVFDYKDTGKSTSGKFTINPKNATQLICDGVIYQVTPEIVDSDKIGTFLAALAQNVTFDNDTKKALSKEELNRIDWSGQNNQGRTNWIYAGVYEVTGIESTELVAVEVNNQYHLAKAQ